MFKENNQSMIYLVISMCYLHCQGDFLSDKMIYLSESNIDQYAYQF